MNKFQNFTAKNLEIVRSNLIRSMSNLHAKKNNILMVVVLGGVIHKTLIGVMTFETAFAVRRIQK